MKISFNWLKEYLKWDKSPEETAGILTDCGLEVEGLEKVESHPGGLEGLVVGKVEKCIQHPNADKLKLTKVNIGNGQVLNIVCGAPNVDEGQKVIVATVGATLFPSEGKSFKIKKSKIRGELSEGMICAEDEIGTGNSHEGILVLPGDTKVGMPASEYFNVTTDWVFEIGLTPNRSDAASHFGVARDLAAVLSQTAKVVLEKPSVEKFKVENTSCKISVEVKNEKACPRYSALCISGVEVKISPPWLINKLKSIGLKPINNIVDITNFVLHEIGQPLHAFDADKISSGKVVVQTLPSETEFTTLDGLSRKLHSDDLMICNANEGMCIAGVFGGQDSGVNESTKNIFLESAYFDPTYIRKTAKRHGLSTDASFRYERGSDPEVTIYALKRAALLIKELAGGEIASEIIDIYPTEIQPTEIDFSYANCDKLIGQEIDRRQIRNIFINLGMDILEDKEEGLKVSVPAFKSDVKREVDLVEEVLRIYGYNKIGLPHFMKTSLSFSKGVQPFEIQKTIAGFLVSNGFNEIFNNSLSSPKYYDDLKNEVNILNPLSSELSIMRQTLLFGGLEALEYNINRKRENLQFFEFGKTYFKYDGSYQENQRLGLWLHGETGLANWQKLSRKHDFYSLKKIVEEIFVRLGLSSNYKSKELSNTIFSYGLNCTIKKKSILDFGQVNKNILEKNGIETTVFYADFNWDNILELISNKDVQYEPVAKFPSVRRDLALLVDVQVKFSDIEKIAKQMGSSLLQEINLFDVYEGKNLPSDKKSYAVSFTFLDKEKTLTDQKIEQLMKNILTNLEKELDVQLR